MQGLQTLSDEPCNSATRPRQHTVRRELARMHGGLRFTLGPSRERAADRTGRRTAGHIGRCVKRLPVIAVGCLLLFGVVSCEKQAENQIQRAPSPSDQIMGLKQELDQLRIDFELHKSTLETDLDEMRSTLSGAHPVEIHVTTKGYRSIHTPSGVLFIACTGAGPYLNGHKLKLKIGNPLWAAFDDFKLKSVYGLKQPQMPTGPYEPKTWEQYWEASNKALKSRRETEARFAETIAA